MKKFLPSSAAGIVVGLVLVLAFVGVRALAAAPTGALVTDKVSAPLQRGPTIVTKALSTARVAIFADLDPTTLKKDSIAQLITVESKASNTNILCVKQVDLTIAAPEVCNDALCAAQAFTCSGASTDGEWVDPGETLPLRPAGVVCACAQAAANAPVIQAKRVAR